MNDTIELQGKIVMEIELIKAYIGGKRSAYLFYRGVAVEEAFFSGKIACPYDKRTRQGRLWKLGYSHALDEMKGIFYIPPIEIFGGSLHKIDYKKLLKKD